MRKLFQLLAAIKTIAAFAFTGEMMLVTVVFMFWDKRSIPIGYIWQMIFLAFIYGCLQLLAFSENTFKRMNTPGRMTFLGASTLMALALFALTFQWFPTQSLINWLIFIGIYTVIFSIAVFALRTVFRLGGIKYNELLVAYKARREG